jgi:hypothetical protein
MPRLLSWSAICCGVGKPDGGHFVYLRRAAGKYSLMIVRTSGAAKPVLLKENVASSLPDCSRTRRLDHLTW